MNDVKGKNVDINVRPIKNKNKSGGGGEIEGWEILARDGQCCAYSGRRVSGDEGDRVYIDHVIPWVLGGQTVNDNGRVSCGPCNSSKGAKVW